MPFGLISGLINSAASMKTAVDNNLNADHNRMQEELINNLNWERTKEIINKNRTWELEDQKRLEEREDTAIQRRAKDLEAAGINPLLAGGIGGASAGTANSKNTAMYTPAQFTPTPPSQAPHLEIGDPLQRKLEREEKLAQIENIEADTKAKREGARGTQHDNTRKEIENEYIRNKIQKELEGLELNNKNLEQTGKNLMAEFGYKFSEEQRAKAMHEIEKLNKQTERALNQAKTYQSMSETGLTDKEKEIRQKEFNIKKEQIEKGYLLEIMKIFGDTAVGSIRAKK